MPAMREVRFAVLGAAVVLLVGATTGDAQNDLRGTRLTLSGEGYAEQGTEFVTISAATESWSRSPRRAIEDNATDMKQLRARLARLSVAEADFQTADFRFSPSKDPKDDDGDRADGYSVRHQLAVVIRDTDKLGAIIDELAAAGAAELSVNRGWGYSGEVNPQTLRAARALAIKDAMTKANDYAAALNMKVKRVIAIQDRSGHITDRRMLPQRVAADVATQIETRPQTVLASVGVEFELTR